MADRDVILNERIDFAVGNNWNSNSSYMDSLSYFVYKSHFLYTRKRC